MRRKFDVVRVEEDEQGNVIDMLSGREFIWDPHKLNESIALLKLIPKGASIEGVGKHVRTNIFYVRFYTEEEEETK